tara:strand:- start:351 stop:518 length:168 start_codon:yes stop_codon:yes gene_type:complete
MSDLEMRLNELKDTCYDMTNLDGMNKELWRKHASTVAATLLVIDILTTKINEVIK